MGVVLKFDIQRFVVTGDTRQLALVVPAEVVGVFMAVVDAVHAPLAGAGGIRLIDLMIAFAGLDRDRAVRAGKEPEPLVRIGDHIAAEHFAEPQLAPAHIFENQLIIRQTVKTRLKRHHPAGSKHAGGAVAAVVDTLPVERHTIRQHKVEILLFGEDLCAAGNIDRESGARRGDKNGGNRI